VHVLHAICGLFGDLDGIAAADHEVPGV